MVILWKGRRWCRGKNDISGTMASGKGDEVAAVSVLLLYSRWKILGFESGGQVLSFFTSHAEKQQNSKTLA